MKFLAFILLLSKTAYAAYAPREDKIPLELHHLITALQTSELYSVHQQEINLLIPQIDRAFSSLDDEDVGLIAKSEIYRTLLKHPSLLKAGLCHAIYQHEYGINHLVKKTPLPLPCLADACHPCGFEKVAALTPIPLLQKKGAIHTLSVESTGSPDEKKIITAPPLAQLPDYNFRKSVDGKNIPPFVEMPSRNSL